MAVTPVGTPVELEGDGGTASSLSGSVTVPVGSNMGLALALSRGFPSEVISGVTFDGNAMTRPTGATVESADDSLCEIWVIALGDLGSPLTGDVVVTPASSTRMAGVAQPVEGLHQTTPVPQVDTDATGGTVSLTSVAAGSLVFAAFAERAGSVVTSDQTDIATADSGGQLIAAAAYATGGGNISTTWSPSGGAGFVPAAVAVELAAAAGGGGDPEGPLIGGKLLNGGLLMRRLVA